MRSTPVIGHEAPRCLVALEEPDLLADDLREFFRPLRSAARPA
jgi:hypothetical protein